ncbi:hypothetical protein D3C80_1935850 [compost metagenome]
MSNFLIARSIPFITIPVFLARYLAVSASSDFKIWTAASPPYLTAVFVITKASLTNVPLFPTASTSPLLLTF